MATLNRQLLKIQLGSGTKANILATKTNNTAWNGEMAYATDTNELYIYNYSELQWKKVPFVLTTQSPTPDIGMYQDSSPIGIQPPSSAGSDGVITDYIFVNGKIGSQGIASNGGIRFNGGYLQVYANSTWNNVVVGFTFEEIASYGYALTHLPSGLTYKLEVMSGNSITSLGLDGMPLTQGYVTNMGAYGGFQSVGGRTIN